MISLTIKVCRFCMSPYKAIIGNKEFLIKNKTDFTFKPTDSKKIKVKIQAGICKSCLCGKD